MTETMVHGIALDECIACGAFWFDAGELENYLSEKINDNKDQISLISRFIPIDNDYEEFCPKCEHKKLIYGKIGQLSLSRCEECNGFFIQKEQIQSGRGTACEPLVEALLMQLVLEAGLSFLDGL